MDEKVNAAMPVFLCKEHWEIGRLLMDRILGWIVTLDPLGYTIKQKVAFPFILLEYNILDLYRNGTTAFGMKYFRIIIETCLNVMLDQENSKSFPLKDTLLREWNHYVTKNQRLPENIESGCLFWLKWFCAMVLGWLKASQDEIEEVYYFLVEEELRRCQEKEFSSFSTYEEIDILIQTPEKQQEIIDKYTQKYNNLFFDNCLCLALVKEMMIKYKGDIEEIDLFKSFAIKQEADLLANELKISDKTQLFSMFFQNQLHHVNLTRKKAFEEKNYVDCRKNWKEVFFQFEETIKKAKEKRQIQVDFSKSDNIDVNKLRKKFRNVEVLNMLSLFKETEDLKEAEELLDSCLKKKPGRVLDYYLNISVGCKALLYEKLMLLKKKQQRFMKTITKKFNYPLCYSSSLLTYDQKLDVFGNENLPKSLKKKN